jgi:hypothetical protein
MTLTPAEKQRRYRQRQKQEGRAASFAMADVFRKPFFEFDGDLDFDHALSLAGIPAPTFVDDRGPKDFVLNGATDGVESPFLSIAQGSLGRAELIIGCLADAATALATQVNKYKRSEIKQRITEIEAQDLTDPETKKAAFKEVTRLNKMLDQLSKQVRWTFPEWTVTG